MLNLASEHNVHNYINKLNSKVIYFRKIQFSMELRLRVCIMCSLYL